MAMRSNHMIDLGMLSYNNHLYWAAAQRLQQGVEQEPNDWNAWFYLGMSFVKEKDYGKAENVFTHIRDECTNKDILEKSCDLLNFIYQKRQCS